LDFKIFAHARILTNDVAFKKWRKSVANRFPITKDVAFAEVTTSTLTEATGQCWKSCSPPRFGSIVHIDNGASTVFGIVSEIQTGSLDPTRTPFAYEKTEDELKSEQPQIFNFLTTTFKVSAIGYETKRSGIGYALVPPTPSRVHAFICKTPVASLFYVLRSSKFMRLIFSNNGIQVSIDELLLAVATNLAADRILSPEIIKQIGESFAYGGADYRRIRQFFVAAEQMLHPTREKIEREL
jgi:hypothetical protein